MRSRVTLAFLLLVALAGLGAGGYLMHRRASATPSPATLTIGAERLRFSSAYLRQTDAGATELAVFFPGFAPAAGLADVTDKTDLADRFARVVFIALRPADPAIEPSERTERLYQRFLDDNSWSQAGGLTGRVFVADSPFAGDELLYVAPDGREFAARCRLPDPQGQTPTVCNAEFRLGGLDVGLRFSSGLLAEWRALKDGATRLIEAARR